MFKLRDQIKKGRFGGYTTSRSRLYKQQIELNWIELNWIELKPNETDRFLHFKKVDFEVQKWHGRICDLRNLKLIIFSLYSYTWRV